MQLLWNRGPQPPASIATFGNPAEPAVETTLKNQPPLHLHRIDLVAVQDFQDLLNQNVWQILKLRFCGLCF